MFPTIKRVLLCLMITMVLAISFPQATQAQPSKDEIIELIRWRAQVHGAPVQLMLNVAQCESRFNPNAVGKLGERGLFQWLPGRLNAWDYTSAYRVSSIDIITAYQRADPNSVYYDIDAAAELFARGIVVIRWHWANTYWRNCN